MSATRLFLRALAITAALAAWTACAESTEGQSESTPAISTSADSPAVIASIDPADLLVNGLQPFPGVLVGGQPTMEQLERVRDLGYTRIVNLRMPDELGSTTAEQVEALGMEYVPLPISGSDALDEEHARALAAALEGADGPIMVHCGSGNRVGALFALKAFYVDHASPEEALQIGRQSGLTRLEPVVRDKLGLVD